MNNKTIQDRLLSLRAFMTTQNLHAFVVPSTDAHLSEYPSSHWMSRQWISGFTGSAGTFVVTKDKAGLWTDSRYFLQAEKELSGTGINLFKEGLPKTPTIDAWLLEELDEGQQIGIDGNVYAAKDAKVLAKKLAAKKLTLVSNNDPFDTIWTDRPQIPTNPLFLLPIEFSGKSASEKIALLCADLERQGADSILVSSLDTIAWIFNIRGNDVKCNPVAVAYAYISKKETVLFVAPQKTTTEVTTYLQGEGVIVADYTKIESYIASLNAGTRVCITENKISLLLYNQIPNTCSIIDIPSPADLLKSLKNEVEIEGFRNAMQRDGVALVHFYRWLEKAVPSGDVSEQDIVDKLIEYRSQQKYYVGESFDTIAGYAGNGAIVHYHVTPQSAKKLKPEGFVLIDSGAQYFDGTTDITRTIALGKLSEQMQKDYTMVLKGHIAIASCIYPQGTRGSQLDILARKALWDNRLNYLHGTGHGVGHFLNVHEGPQSIRLDENSTTLQPGMVTSNEPGMYRANEYGIRIENLVLTQYDSTSEFGDFYSFETLTLCPIDTTPLVKSMLTNQEIDWLNNYHKKVYDRLSPDLNDEGKAWLKEKTTPIELK